MIAKKYRLREYEVSRVFKKGRPFFSEFWSLHCLEIRGATSHRIAVSISRKHDKRAVQRNRYRRGLYDGMLIALKAPTDKYFQCVFTLRKGQKILERKIPEYLIEDALKLFEKRK